MDKFNKHIMIALVEMLDDVNENDTIEQIKSRHSDFEIFQSILAYEGIHGYASTILSWVNDVYGTDLETHF